MTIHKRFIIVLFLGLYCDFNAWAFTVPIHADITNESLSAFTATVAGNTEHFSAAAMKSVQDANAKMDDRPTWAIDFPEGHFTNETFSQGSRRLLDLRDLIVGFLIADPPNGDEARLHLGQALHAIQDYYSHTTWVEKGNTSIDTRLGRKNFIQPSIFTQPCRFMGTSITAPDEELTSGYYVGWSGCGYDGNVFYFEANFQAYPGNDSFPGGKCFHGNYTMACIGINKDTDVPIAPAGFGVNDKLIMEAGGVAPANPLHPVAEPLQFRLQRTSCSK